MVGGEAVASDQRSNWTFQHVKLEVSSLLVRARRRVWKEVQLEGKARLFIYFVTIYRSLSKRCGILELTIYRSKTSNIYSPLNFREQQLPKREQALKTPRRLRLQFGVHSRQHSPPLPSPSAAGLF